MHDACLRARVVVRDVRAPRVAWARPRGARRARARYATRTERPENDVHARQGVYGNYTLLVTLSTRYDTIRTVRTRGRVRRNLPAKANR